MTRTLLSRGVSAGALLVASLSSVAAQEALPSIDVAGEGAPRGAEQNASAPGFSPEKKALPVYRDPTGQTFTTVKSEDFKTSPLVTIGDLVEYSPGVSFKQGNGPRDMTLSIRGSGARIGGAMRNIVLLEDGFTMTQPDGFSRTDSTDPHAYAGVDVYRGPSSALFGNWANGGAINFRTRTGAEIDGVETGHEAGSFGYFTNYTAIGKKYGDFDIAVFASDARGEGSTTHTDFNTQTVNLKASYEATPTDRFTFKWVHNQLYANVPARLSLNQFYVNPYQRGCYGLPTPSTIVSRSLCGQTAVFLNGTNGATAQVSALQSGWHRNDRRDMLGLRWEHDLDAQTTLRTQFIYDDKDFYQPIDTPVTYGDAPSINISTDLTNHGALQGRELTSNFGVWYSHARFTTYSQNLLGWGNGDLGPLLTNKQEIMHSNLGARFREELELAPDVTGVIALASEMSKVAALSSSVSYPSGALTTVPANRTFWNFAPEASVTWRPDREWKFYARASSGYGTPQYGFLFVNQQGLDGNNTNLKSQRNTGFDAGFDWTPTETLKVTLNGFYEWYQNEMLTQSPGNGLKNYTYNAPGSVHRGAEFLLDWRPFDGWRLLANYAYNNQIFTQFTEQRGPTSYFDRAGNKIPGVAPHELTTRIGYDIPQGDFKGVGAYLEYVLKSSYFIDNGNQLTIPGYGLVNLNLHYDRDVSIGFLKNISAFIEVRNVFDRTYVASATVISNSLGSGFQNPGFVLSQNSTGSIYAGQPRAVQAGVKFKF
ncbi:MAG TPA: TonB-dependent receptor [Methylosinus sp.]|jgi:iron complex outermembrane receptor protein|uniref:TonB-dependent receptor family protein n=1 Tax=Methylosinus sp. TaxID=427 RepID=UPI002F93DF9F